MDGDIPIRVTSSGAMEEEGKNRDWSSLPSGLLISVAEHLPLADIARIPAVCDFWAWDLGWVRRGWPPPPPASRAIIVPLEKSSPWLLLPNEDGVGTEYCDFLRLSESQSSGSFPRIRISPLPEMAGRICVGGSLDGWIATIDTWLNPRLLNPLTREEFLLPSLCTLSPYDTFAPIYSDQGDGSMCMISCDHQAVVDLSFERFKFNFVRKIILSSAPPHGIAFLIHGHRYSINHLAMARVGDLTWTPALGSENYGFSNMSDVVYNKNDNKFYGVDTVGRLIVFDLKDYHWGSFKPVEATLLSSVICRELLGLEHCGWINNVVFSSGGDLLQVWRHNIFYEESSEEKFAVLRRETFLIKIFKFDPGHFDEANPTSCWIRVDDLGDDAMFLGLSHSTCITTINKPWLRKNSVYFVEDNFDYRDFTRRDYTCDGGIFSLKDNNIERFFPCHSKVNWPPPAWFMPSCLQFIL